MNCKPILSRLLYACFFLISFLSLSQCDCKNPNQGKGNNRKKQEDDQEKHGGDRPNTKPGLPIPNPSVPPPPPVGPILQHVTEGVLRAMGYFHFPGIGATPQFLVDGLRDLKKDPNQVDLKRRDDRHDGATLLHEAVDYARIKQEEIIKDLLKAGVDINAPDDRRQTPLHLAIKRKNLEIVKTFLEHGATLDTVDDRGDNPIHLAASFQSIEVLQALLAKVTPAQLDQPNYNGHTPLQVAVIARNLPAVQALINQGADIKLCTPDGKNALHLAAARGDLDIVKALTEAGINRGLKTVDGKTAVELAQDQKVITYLGGVWNPPSPMDNDTLDVLEVEVDGVSHKFLADKLRRPDQDINSTDPTKSYSSALLQAAELGNNNMVEFLLARGADIYLLDSSSQTALHKAAKAGHLEVVKTLLAHHASIDLADNDGDTPLLLAGFAGKLDVVKVLVEDYGANINVKSYYGWTPLHGAVERNNLGLLQYLLNKKALVNLRGPNMQTPLYIAAAKGYEQAVNTLLGAGADPNQLGMVSPDKHTLSVAVSNNHLGVVRMLLQAGANVRQEDVNSTASEEMKQLLQGKLTQ